MTTTKEIRAALAQKFTVSSIRENMKTAMSSPWDEELAWCLDQIEKRDKLLAEYVQTCDECYEDEYDIETCPICRRARKVMEESNA